MPNYKLTIQYDGTNYYGWQSQPSGNTIQDRISEVIERVTQRKINLVGSGRTDSGVHALGQVANFRIKDCLELYKFKHALNSILPSDISIKDIIEVEDDFHFSDTIITYNLFGHCFTVLVVCDIINNIQKTLQMQVSPF
mgnify:CR=1 FL=1